MALADVFKGIDPRLLGGSRAAPRLTGSPQEQVLQAMRENTGTGLTPAQELIDAISDTDGEYENDRGADPARLAGLDAAVRRQVAQIRPGLAVGLAADEHALQQELRADDGNDHELGLAKAVARECVRQVGAQRSASAIKAVREIKAGGEIRGRRGDAHDFMLSARVLTAQPRR